LLSRAALIAERNHPRGGAAQLGDDEPDPRGQRSGYWLGKAVRWAKRKFKKVRRAVKKVLSIPIVRTVVNVAIGLACGPGAAPCMALATAALTAAAGGDVGDIVRASAISFASATAFHAVGQEFGNPKLLSPKHLAKTLAHGDLPPATGPLRMLVH